ncbi:AraC family transcriptional regulator [Prolixibacteraceae bacterium JC049]|nr:AraC family transcriptional regulator [Prolixibacteraceae bacterium JC049]
MIKQHFIIYICTLFSVFACNSKKDSIVFENFESDTYKNWEVQGTAFQQPASKDTLQNDSLKHSIIGQRFAYSYYNDGELNQGKLISKPFTIEYKFIDFLIAGGNHPTRNCVNLIIDNKVVRSHTGENQTKLFPVSWNVSNLIGQQAIIEIIDAIGWHSDALEYVMVDQIVFSNHTPQPDILFDDFESGNFDHWKVEGEAFPKPSDRMNTYYPITVNGFNGKYFAFSFGETHDKKKGKLTSTPFSIKRDYIHFLVGGGNHKRKTCVNLRINDTIVHSVTGEQSGDMAAVVWKVSQYKGQKARLEILDDFSGSWGHIMCDDFFFSDSPQPHPAPKGQSYNFIERLPLGVKYFLFLVLLPLVGLYLNKKLAPLFDPSLQKEKKNDNPFVKQLDNYLLTEKAITDSTLTAKKVADHLQMPTNDFNHLVELQYGQSFNDLLNNYRVEAFKEALSKPENSDFTLLAIAESCGFSSKSSFYRTFKKLTGLTPTEFQAQLKLKKQEDGENNS